MISTHQTSDTITVKISYRYMVLLGYFVLWIGLLSLLQIIIAIFLEAPPKGSNFLFHGLFTIFLLIAAVAILSHRLYIFDKSRGVIYAKKTIAGISFFEKSFIMSSSKNLLLKEELETSKSRTYTKFVIDIFFPEEKILEIPISLDIPIYRLIFINDAYKPVLYHQALEVAQTLSDFLKIPLHQQTNPYPKREDVDFASFVPQKKRLLRKVLGGILGTVFIAIAFILIHKNETHVLIRNGEFIPSTEKEIWFTATIKTSKKLYTNFVLAYIQEKGSNKITEVKFQPLEVTLANGQTVTLTSLKSPSSLEIVSPQRTIQHENETVKGFFPNDTICIAAKILSFEQKQVMVHHISDDLKTYNFVCFVSSFIAPFLLVLGGFITFLSLSNVAFYNSLNHSSKLGD